jgi:hypothetical protein
LLSERFENDERDHDRRFLAERHSTGDLRFHAVRSRRAAVEGDDSPFPKVDFPESVPSDAAANTWFAYGYREGIPRCWTFGIAMA